MTWISALRPRPSLKWLKVAALAILTLAAVLYSSYHFYWVWNPLPSDEEMIENFQAHRDDFIEIVRRYREYPRGLDKDPSSWFKESDTLDLFKRAGVTGVDPAAGLWLPNPYTIETARQVLSLSEAAQPKDPALYLAPYRNGSLMIQPATTPLIDHPEQKDVRRHYKNSIIFGFIWKEYMFFPEPPRVVEGRLLWPLQLHRKALPGATYHEGEGVFSTQISSLVLPSLNHFPDNWKEYDCVYRKIEGKWFIRLCNARR